MKRDLPWNLAVVWLCVFGAAALFAGAADPLHPNLDARLAPPSHAHLLGADELGRDVLARVAHGARHAIAVTGGASFLTVTLGALLGVAAAWRRGWLDRAVGLGISFFWAVPVAVAVTLVVTALGVSTGSLIVAIGGINWVSSARIFRAETARLKSGDSLRAARAFGFGPWHLFVTHLMPQLRPVLFTVLGLCAVETLALETGLTFLGLRLPPPIPTWGGMLADGIAYLASAWWIVAVPSLTIVLTLGSLRVLAAHASATTST